MTKIPALFIERDGVLIHNGSSVQDKNQIRLIRTSGNALSEFNSHQIPVVLLVEQPKTEDNSELLTKHQADVIETELKRKLNRLDAHYTTMIIYPKPFEETSHKDAETPEKSIYLSEKFNHRDTETTENFIFLIEKAAELCNFDVKNSWIVTDKFQTLLAAKKADMLGGILVRTGKGKVQEKILTENIKNLHPLEVDIFSSLQIARTKLINYFKKYYLENGLNTQLQNFSKIKI